MLKKQIARTLIEEIEADVDDEKQEIVLIVHWKGGHHTSIREPRRWRKDSHTVQDIVRIVETMRKLLPDDTIAAVLNRAGIFTRHKKSWSKQGVTTLRGQYHIPAFSAKEKQQNGWLTQAETATYLAISPMSVSRLVQRGIIPAEQPGDGLPTVVCKDHLTSQPIQTAVARIKASYHHPLSIDPLQQNLFE